MTMIVLTERGTGRVLNARVGMRFQVDHFTDSGSGITNGCAHVRDYRYSNVLHNGKPFQIWSLGVDDWKFEQ